MDEHFPSRLGWHYEHCTRADVFRCLAMGRKCFGAARAGPTRQLAVLYAG